MNTRPIVDTRLSIVLGAHAIIEEIDHTLDRTGLEAIMNTGRIDLVIIDHIQGRIDRIQDRTDHIPDQSRRRLDPSQEKTNIPLVSVNEEGKDSHQRNELRQKQGTEGGEIEKR